MVNTGWIILHVISLHFIITMASLMLQFETKTYSAAHIEGVVGRPTQLPCNMTTTKKDSVYLVLWFKEGLTTPIYTYDVRALSGGEPKHWWDADLLGTRAFFNAHADPAHLLIRHVTTEDLGLYKCRVDFQKAPTSNSRVNLTIIIPPEEVILLNSDGSRIFNVVGPIKEEEDISLSCIAKGGSPLPSVQWLLDGKLLDDSSEEVTPNFIRNDMALLQLGRDKMNSELTCEAKYHPVFPPVEAMAVIDMYLSPLRVNIKTPDEPMSSGRFYQFSCTSTGSRPPATLTWSIGSKPLPILLEETLNNSSLSRSIVKLKGSSGLNGQILSCKAQNRLIPSSTIEAKINLDIYYAPKVKIKSGGKTNPINLLEGDSIHLKCHTDANPLPYKITWKRNNISLSGELSEFTVLSNWSLLLQNVRVKDAGNYSCVASNVEGDGYSQTFVIKVKHTPYCKFIKPKILGATKDEVLKIPCQVDAFPQPTAYEWWMKDPLDQIDDSKSIKRKFHMKKLHPLKIRQSHGQEEQLKNEFSFIPEGDEDFGTIYCFAKNELGRQEKPCVYNIVPAAFPSPPVNCSIRDVTSSSVFVKCFSNQSDTNQTFILEVFTFKPRKLLLSIASQLPKFRVPGLDADTPFNFRIFARNSERDSDSAKLNVRTLKPPVKQLETRLGTDGRKEKSSTSSLVVIETASILGALIGGISVIIIVLFLSIYLVKRRNRNTNCTTKTTAQNSSQLVQQTINNDDDSSSPETCVNSQEELQTSFERIRFDELPQKDCLSTENLDEFLPFTYGDPSSDERFRRKENSNGQNHQPYLKAKKTSNDETEHMKPNQSSSIARSLNKIESQNPVEKPTKRYTSPEELKLPSNHSVDYSAASSVVPTSKDFNSCRNESIILENLSTESIRLKTTICLPTKRESIV